MTLAHMWWSGDWSGPGLIWGAIGTLASIAFWVIVILVVVKLVKNRPLSVGGSPSGVRILEERYARGEISHEEFVERREVLAGRSAGTSTSPQPPPSL